MPDMMSTIPSTDTQSEYLAEDTTAFASLGRHIHKREEENYIFRHSKDLETERSQNCSCSIVMHQQQHQHHQHQQQQQQQQQQKQQHQQQAIPKTITILNK